MTRAFRVGRIFGIDIEVDYTWFIIFFLVAAALSTGLKTWGLRDLPLMTKWLVAAFATLLFFASVLIHELSHSVVAMRHGLGIEGITLFLFGGVSKMSDEPKSPGDEFRISVAGPATSMALAAIFLGLAFLARRAPGGDVFNPVFTWLAAMNGMLAIFNLLPGFPLDGGRVLRAGLWRGLGNLAEATRIASTFGHVLGILMIVGGILLFLLGGGGGALWLSLIGWFLTQAAQSSYQQVLLRQALSGVPVSAAMTQEVQWIPADITLDQVVHEFVMMYNHPAFPVMDNGQLLGLLCVNDVRAVPREQWGYVTARQVVPPLSEANSITPQTDAWDTLVKMTADNCGRLMVVEDGRLLGIISRTDIMRLMRMRMELGV